VSDSWHVLGDYIGACIVVVSVLAALHYRGQAKERTEELERLEQTLDEVLADDEPKTPRSK
jgi:hypothetical protein